MDKGDHGVGRGDRYFFCSIFNLFIVPYGNEGCVLVVLKKMAQQHEIIYLNAASMPQSWPFQALQQQEGCLCYLTL